MAKYYNKTSGSLAVTLKSGRSLILTGKSWSEVPADEEGSEDIVRAVRRGFIVRSAIENRTPPTAKAVPAAPPPAEEVKPVEAEKSAPVERPSERTLAGEKTSENTRRKKG